MKNKILFNYLLLLIFCLCARQSAFGQVEIAPWGNLSGIRVDGQLMEVGSNLSVVKGDWASITATGKEMQRPKYVRKGGQQIITTNIDSLYFTETVEDLPSGGAKMTVEVIARENLSLTGVYFRLMLPRRYYNNGTVQADNQKPVNLAALQKGLNLPTAMRSLFFRSSQRQVRLLFAEPTTVLIDPSSAKEENAITVFIPVKTGDVQKGQAYTKTVTLTAAGVVDKKPVVLTLNTASVGRSFDGLGGNFRLQNPRTDPQVIDYSLTNLRVAWARVEMPWRFWQPKKTDAPVDAAKNGSLHPAVKAAMEMAQRLSKMGIPVILSAWSAPSWAIVGPPRFRPGPDGVWGNPLNKDSALEIYRSIADYISYLKAQYGVEAAMFSFNESDLGINIRQTGSEHAELIKGLGAYLQQRGLKTKMLLGDNSDATTYQFIDAALNDPATHPYIGAISFHSWRGWEKETLQHWADAATRLGRPLLVGEGSIDAQAWGYPAVFEEPTYALQEIDLYTRLLAICQPASILQWQLTADYSPLAGGGIFGDTTPLRPTQRFWNLKQLAATPKGLKAMPVTASTTTVSCAALGDANRGSYVLHLVNIGATRQVTINGLPKNIKQLQVFVTDAKHSMQQEKPITVTNGQAIFTLAMTSYVTLMTETGGNIK